MNGNLIAAAGQLGLLCLVASLLPLGAMPAVAQTTDLSNHQQSNALAQVTSVSQLSDVQPTDWAFQALQSLVERYGSIPLWKIYLCWQNIKECEFNKIQ